MKFSTFLISFTLFLSFLASSLEAQQYYSNEALSTQAVDILHEEQDYYVALLLGQYIMNSVIEVHDFDMDKLLQELKKNSNRVVDTEFRTTNGSTIKLYPNPVEDYFYFQGGFKPIEARIYDGNGELVYKNKDLDNEVNLINLQRGVYTMYTLSKQGEIVSLRFIKK